MKSRISALVAIWLFVTVGAYAQAPYQASFTDEKIRLDGVLHETAWLQAVEVASFLQFYPIQGGSPSEKTTFRILYDHNFIYLGISAFVKNRADIVATEMERDADLYTDDRVGIILDTYRDRLNGVGFITNPLGLRFDTDLSQDGQVTQESWDTFWDVETTIQDSAWVAEFRIPFSSLRFQPSDTLTMGFKIIRSITEHNEFDVYPPGDPTISNFLFRLTMAAPLRFAKVEAKKPLYFSPYVTAEWSEENNLNEVNSTYINKANFMKRTYIADHEVLDKVLSNVGFNIKYGLTKNFTLDLTTNTDFSQVEVDDRVINFTRFNVNLPEKREFFLESNDYLNFDVGQDRVFNSRNIGIRDGQLIPVLGGIRLTGKANGYQVGFLNMQTQGIAAIGLGTENNAVFRIRKSILNEASTIGGIITNKLSFGDSVVSNQVVGVDLLYRINQKWMLDVKGSYSTNHLKGNTLQNNGYYNFRLVKNSSKGFFHDVKVGSIGKSYESQLGFVLLNDITYADGQNGYIYVVKNPKRLANIQFINSSYYRYRISTQRKETFYTEPVAIDINFLNGTYFYGTYQYLNDTLSEAWDIRKDITIPVNRYTMHNYYFEYGSNENANYYVVSSLQYGDFYGGKRFVVHTSMNNNFTKNLKVGLEYDFNRIAFPNLFYTINSTKLFTSHLLTLKLTVAFSTKVNIKTLLQYDNLSNNLFYNIRFRYNPKQGNDLYLIFNQGINTYKKGLDPRPPLIERQVIGLKYVHTFDLSKKKTS